MRLRRLGSIVAFVATFAGVSELAAQPVSGDAVSAGFPAKVQSRAVIREGQWFPIVLKLNVPGTQHFQGYAAVERADLDGDLVDYAERAITVTAGGMDKRVWVYAVSLKEDVQRTLAVDIVADDGVRVAQFVAPQPEMIGNDTLLILDISKPFLPGVATLDSGGASYIGPSYGARTYYRSICVTNMPPEDVPDRWFGLEAVDVLVWDEPDPDKLSPAQIDAIIQWVRAGGQLVVGLGAAGPRVSKSPLGAIMPLQGVESTVESPTLDSFLRRYGPGDEEARFKSALSISIGKPAAGAHVTRRDTIADGREVPTILIGAVESGRVVATTPRLSDLFSISIGPRPEFLMELFDLCQIEGKFKTNEGEASQLTLRQPVGLHPVLIEPTEFRAVAGYWILISIGFVVSYILIATWFAWGWLRRKSATHLSWSVFAGCAVVASVISMATVGLVRGLFDSVVAVSFVDLEAGATDARVRAWYGYKSARPAQVALTLGADGSYLRPMSTGAELGVPYATPRRYTAVAAKGLLEDAPMRATLKQFEGFTAARLDGSIRGTLYANRRSGRIESDSFIENGLPTEITAGVLLYIDPRLPGATPPDRPMSVRARTFAGKPGPVPPSVNVLAVPIEKIPSGQRAVAIGQKKYAEFDLAYAKWSVLPDEDGKAKKEPMLDTLWRVQNSEWMPAFGTTLSSTLKSLLSDDQFCAAMLASTRSLYLHNGYQAVTDHNFDQVGEMISTEGLVSLDVMHWLAAGQAVVLLYAEQPGPAPLLREGRPLRMRGGYTVYRVRMPIEYRGTPG